MREWQKITKSVARATDVRGPSPHSDLMQDNTLTMDRLRRWAASSGPHGLLLFEPLLPLLEKEPCPPARLDLKMQPARWLLEQAIAGDLRIDREGLLVRDYAAQANTDFGWAIPVLQGTEPPHLEIDALYYALRSSHLLEVQGRMVRVARETSRLITDHIALWKRLCSDACSTPDLLATGLQVTFAALLREELDPIEVAALEVKVSVERLFGREPTDDEGNMLAASWNEVLGTVMTLGRSLSMLAPGRHPIYPRPTLTEMGRATAVLMLRGFAARISGRLGPAWN